LIYTNDTVITNSFVVTNAIGWHIDRQMVSELDVKIKNIVPLYLDPVSVTNGLGPVALTVTGLWAQLSIGNGTNQFTRTPCWTNVLTTNYIVSYTTYYPTGDVAAVCYTSREDQVVNYASAWDGSNYAWTVASNWPAIVLQETNSATYGELPWQVYAQDLEERYKVLNALKVVNASVTWGDAAFRRLGGGSSTSPYPTNWATATAQADAALALTAVGGAQPYGYTIGYLWPGVGYRASKSFSTTITVHRVLAHAQATNLNGTVSWYVSLTNYQSDIGYDMDYDQNGTPNDEMGVYYLWTNISMTAGVYSNNVPICSDVNWCDEPVAGTNMTLRGFDRAGHFLTCEPEFMYCTNKYW
jgi:hypothetical protein